MVYDLDGLENKLWDFTDRLKDFYEECGEIPVVGSVIARAVYQVYYSFWYISYTFQNVNTWVDGIIDYIRDLEYYIDLLFDNLYYLSDIIAGFITWDNIRDKILDTWDIIAHTWREVLELIPSWRDLIPENAFTNFNELMLSILDYLPEIPNIDMIENWVVDRFESILDVIFREDK